MWHGRHPCLLGSAALAVVTAVVAACGGGGEEASPPEAPVVCGPGELPTDNHEVDLDGVAPAEVVYLRPVDDSEDNPGKWEVGVCAGEQLLSSVELEGPDLEILGFVDLGHGGASEILVTGPGPRGPQVRAATLTARGLALTDLGVEVWFDGDTSTRPSAPFEAAGFECSDVDGDGRTDLVVTEYQPAEELVHVGVAKVLLDGTTTTTAGVDAYETGIDQAFGRWRSPDGCAPRSSPEVSVEVGANGWARLRPGDAFASDGDVVLTGVAFDDTTGTYVVVGTERPSMVVGEVFQPRPVIWSSTDAVHWERGALGEAGGELRDVISPPGGGFVAVGATDTGRAAVWRSADGVGWDLIEVRAAAVDRGAARAVVSAVTATPQGLVAVGTEDYAPGPGGPGPDLDAAVWRSPDGDRWARVEAPSLGTIGYQPNEEPEFNGELVGVAHHPGVGLVVVGSASDPTDPTLDFPVGLPTAWVSPDGMRWSRHDIDAELRLRGVTSTGRGLVAHGVSTLSGSPDQDGVILTSPDGASWTRIDGPFDAIDGVDGAQAINAVVEVPGHGLVAVGTDQQEFETIGGAAAWWSTDDLTSWQREAHDDTVFETLGEPPTATMTDAVTVDGRVVVIGFANRSVPLPAGSTCCVSDAAIWFWEPT